MQSPLAQTFSNRHVLLPVIHAEGKSQALRNATIAYECGCDGVFLINHSVSHAGLMDIHRAAAEAFPGWWVGINSLGADPATLFAGLPESVAGLWVDNAGIDEREEAQAAADRIAEARRTSGWSGLYFGGVAFKYQRQVSDIERACRVAMRYMDVVTTSGPGTGEAASREKIETMKRALGGFPLAIASGITPENVAGYLDIADCFLVATGISDSFTELNRGRVEMLVRTVRESDGGRPGTESR